MAFEPPPTQATTTSGSPPVRPALARGLVADDPVELAHHPRIGVGPIAEPRRSAVSLDGADPVAAGPR